MATFTRRDFMVGAAATGAAAFVAGVRAQAAGKGFKGTDTVTLGNTGIKTSRLGVGTGTKGGSEQLGIGQDAFVKMMRHAHERGIRYIDTADNYRTHLFTRFALAELPRDEMFVQSKTPAKSAEVAAADIERFRKELKTDYIDSLLLHCMRTGGWEADMRPVIDVLLEAKEQGKVRAVGVSCHGWDPLADSVGCEWLDVHLVRINPFEVMMDGKPEDVVREMEHMKAAGRGIIGMKIFGETGFETEEQRIESLKYVLGLGCVDAFTIGMSSTAQIDDTLRLIELASA